MKEILGNTVVFVVLYILFMLPTYYLPYTGSNSFAVNAIGAAAGAGINPTFWLHLGSLMVLVVLAWFRGALVGKQWLVIFPILAAVFDLLPGLSSIPLVPTVMHLLAVILGVVGTTNAIAVAAPTTIRNSHSSVEERREAVGGQRFEEPREATPVKPAERSISEVSHTGASATRVVAEQIGSSGEKESGTNPALGLALKPAAVPRGALPLVVIVGAIIVGFLANSLHGARQEVERLRAVAEEQTGVSQREAQARSIAEQQLQVERQARLSVEAQLGTTQKRVHQEAEARKNAETAASTAQKAAREVAEAKRQVESAEAQKVAREQAFAARKANAEVEAKRRYEDSLARAEKQHQDTQERAKKNYQNALDRTQGKLETTIRARQNYESDLARAQKNYQENRARAETAYGDAMARAQKTYEQVSVAR